MCMLPLTAIWVTFEALVASKWPQWPQRLNLTSDLKYATTIIPVSMWMLPLTAILVASEVTSGLGMRFSVLNYLCRRVFLASKDHCELIHSRRRRPKRTCWPACFAAGIKRGFLALPYPQTTLLSTYQNVVGCLRSVQNDIQVLFRRVKVPRAETNSTRGSSRLQNFARHIAILQGELCLELMKCSRQHSAKRWVLGCVK